MKESDISSTLGKSLDLGIYDRLGSMEEAEYFKMLLLDASAMTHLYELFLFFKKIEKKTAHEALLIFFDLFSGCTLEVPKREKIDQAIRDTRIFYCLSRAEAGTRAARIRDLAREYDLSDGGVLSIYGKMQKLWKNHRGFEDEIKTERASRVGRPRTVARD